MLASYILVSAYAGAKCQIYELLVLSMDLEVGL